MSDTALNAALGVAEFEALGLLGNPFASAVTGRAPLSSMVSRAAALRLAGALRADAEGRPIWLRTDSAIPATYGVLSVAEVLRVFGADDGSDCLVGYVPLELFRLGRVRGALGVIAERIINPSFGLTLGRYMATVLDQIDPALPEAANLDPERLAIVGAALAADPEAVAAEVFGRFVMTRDDLETTEVLYREEAFRQSKVEADPEEGSDSQEDDGAPLGEDGAEPLDEAPLDEADVAEAVSVDPIYEYVIAHTKAHLSPVVARGLAAYKEHGAGVASQELKLSKAPRKTLTALVRFAGCRYRHVVILHDQFEAWANAPTELRAKIASAISEVRWAIAPVGVVAVSMAPGTVPELEEQFAAAIVVDWTFPEVLELTKPEFMGAVPPEWVVEAVIESARVPGADIDPRVGDVVRASLAESVSLADFRDRAASAIEALLPGAE